ncbi:M16 family metallopeptidase [Thaumasiovibrio subtropicus]|uniref:M16 family metallopeptidase n=1 Tax=Thaumasiovibrio subtropicus TaxID=1891207 RepID=UPI000B355FFB|nr:M16 family metallopeptidase [Thaumasiovibrio subtropicus]
MKKWLGLGATLVVLSGCGTTTTTQFEPDPNWVQGELSNGLSYHLYQKEGDAVSVRMVVHAGSLQETSNQYGYAHFLEHMAFNGSEHFSENDVIRFFEQAGVAFGPDINAFTSYEHTVYQLELPKNEQIDKALMWMADIGHRLSLEPEQIEAEKGVVLGEIRVSRPDPKPFGFQAYEYSIKDTPFEHADPLGSVNSVSNLDRGQLVSYYQTWYQPQLTEIIITGDIEPTALKASLEKHFADWQRGNTALRAKTPFEPQEKKGLTSTTTVGELPSMSVAFLEGQSGQTTLEKQQDDWMTYLKNELIYQRLSNDFQLAGLPVSHLGTGSQVIGDKVASHYQVIYSEGARVDAQQQFLLTLGQLRDHGITQSELDAVLGNWRRNLDNHQQDFERMTAGQLSSMRVEQILAEQPTQLPSQREKNLADFLAKISVKKVNRSINDVLSSKGTFFNGGEMMRGLATPSQLANRYHVDTEKPLTLTTSSELPQPTMIGEITQQHQDEFGSTYWTLSNGIEVMYRQLPEANNEVFMVLSAVGGTHTLPYELQPASILFPEVIVSSGVGPMNGVETDRFVRKQDLLLEPFVHQTYHGVEVHAGKKQLADALNLLHQGLVNPKFDVTQIERVKQARAKEYAVFLDSPIGKSLAQIANTVYANDKNWSSLYNAEDVTLVDEAKLREVYTRLFQTTDFKLTVVGSAEPETLEPLLRKYIASIPLQGDVAPLSKWHLDSEYPAEQSLAANPENKTVVIMGAVSKRSEPRSAQDVFLEDMLLRATSARMITNVRETHSLDYSPGVVSTGADSSGAHVWELYSTVDPSKEQQVKSVMAETMASLAEGFSQEEFDAVASQLSVAFNDLHKDPIQYTWQVARYRLNGYGYQHLLDGKATVDSVSKADLNALANEVFGSAANHYTFSLQPEK